MRGGAFETANSPLSLTVVRPAPPRLRGDLVEDISPVVWDGVERRVVRRFQRRFDILSQRQKHRQIRQLFSDRDRFDERLPADAADVGGAGERLGRVEAERVAVVFAPDFPMNAVRVTRRGAGISRRAIGARRRRAGPGLCGRMRSEHCGSTYSRARQFPGRRRRGAR
jgi:hypothetical protein